MSALGVALRVTLQLQPPKPATLWLTQLARLELTLTVFACGVCVGGVCLCVCVTGVVVAYSESPEVRQAVDPVLSVVSEPAQAVGKSAGKVAVGAGKLALATGKYVGHQTVAASKLVGHHALSTSKVVGAGVGKATVASGMTLSDSAVLAGRAVGRMMLGEAPVARVGVVGASADATASQDPRSGYEFVGEKRQSMYEFVGEKRQSDAPVPVPQHPNVGHIGSVESPAPTTASSYLCGLDRVTAIVGTSLVTAASAGIAQLLCVLVCVLL